MFMNDIWSNHVPQETENLTLLDFRAEQPSPFSTEVDIELCFLTYSEKSLPDILTFT